ncbi:hypothetical protein BR93DRAFT_965940 [Coniochaeta sp. PMI_546]|nr:hypothetical protein BR93DRAFT_965940 [Coniochaeta sp. PMI_546]
MVWDHLTTEEATNIAKSLEKYKLKYWGFVIFRCTYSSQEKWDKFLTLVKEDCHSYFEDRGMEDIYDKMLWTVIEDAQTLDGATIPDANRSFLEWVENEGKQEMRGSVFPNNTYYAPRYSYFLYVDEESLESVADDEKAREPGGYFCKVVRSRKVQMDEEATNEDREEDDEEEDEGDKEHRLRGQRKRVKVDQLVLLYNALLNTDTWWNMYTSAVTNVVEGI